MEERQVSIAGSDYITLFIDTTVLRPFFGQTPKRFMESGVVCEGFDLFLSFSDGMRSTRIHIGYVFKFPTTDEWLVCGRQTTGSTGITDGTKLLVRCPLDQIKSLTVTESEGKYVIEAQVLCPAYILDLQDA